MPDEDAATATATQVAPGEGKPLWFLTELYTTKLTSEHTGGAFTLVEVTGTPQAPPVPHMHHNEDETYYVLEGEWEFLSDGRTFTAGPGSVVYLPKHRLHSHRNPGDGQAKALVLYTPGGVEKFVEEAGRPGAQPSSLPPPVEEEDIQRVVGVAGKYGFEAPPPPSAPE